ncbi:hypothetical protein HNO92_004335 [Chromobacterium alkanivorans]|uniref:hypothetical protein n=1 Tax=Chromobacterium alkanivorans TaxID=1071719 RepID=UPI002167DDEC|nr:hypothetical protein [Chromobacterium alkanivorans]MCS3806726.1 hypothetical protein [Chromobacterium alkanivorans]MCS3821102.1 hypothetical protein [Chromobacterium alkanivorans]MCS3875986.1 hypothetical protein [Chromobacterium alkanivorans]
MARKAAETQPQAADNTLPALPAMAEAANRLAVIHAEQEATVRAVAAQLGYQLPADCTDPDLIQRDIAANMRRSVEACLEVGRGLRVLKEACEHGNFISRLDSLGVEVRVAQRFMQAAVKFTNASTSTHLIKAIGSSSKLIEMLVLDDEQIEELELTGQTGELKLDDIATMSVKELRTKLRELRENAEAQARLLADKNTKIDELAAKLTTRKTHVKTPPPDVEGEAIRKEASQFAFEAESVVRGKLHAAFQALVEHSEKHGLPHDDFMAGLIGQLELSTRQLRNEFGVKERPDGQETPDWLRDPEPVLPANDGQLDLLRAEG